MPDVEISLIGHNRVGSAARAAAKDLDQLGNKLSKFNKTAKINVKTDVDVKGAKLAKFRAAGRRFGDAFSTAMGNAIADGTRAIGSLVKKILLASPGLQAFAAFFAVRLAGLLGQALTAAFALALGPALLAG